MFNHIEHLLKTPRKNWPDNTRQMLPLCEAVTHICDKQQHTEKPFVSGMETASGLPGTSAILLCRDPPAAPVSTPCCNPVLPAPACGLPKPRVHLWTVVSVVLFIPSR